MRFLRNLQGTTLNRNLNYYLRRHFISVIITVICILLFIGFTLDSNRGASDAFTSWGAPSIDEIRDGKIWGLITNNLLESNLLFLLFSLGWLWNLGRFIEQRVGSLFYLWLIISSCVFTSVMEIAIFEDTGYGFGAITFSMFGFVLARSLSTPLTWNSEPSIEIQFILWVVICLVINYTGIYKIAYGGYFFGFVWGALLAFLETLRNKIGRIAIPLLLLGVCSISIFWAPWSIVWLKHEAHKYYDLKDYDRAKSLCLRILEKDPNNEEGKEGLQLIRIHEMREEAYKLYSGGNVSEAQNICSKILKIDSNDEWAKKCAEGFPDE